MAGVATTGRRPGRPPKTAAARAAERQAMLASIRRSVAERGPDVSVDELAALAGVSKPTVYAQFGDKAGLAEALALAVMAEVQPGGAGAGGAKGAESAESALAALRAGIDAFTRFMADETNLYRFIVRSVKAVEADALDNAMVPAFHRGTAAVVARVFPDLAPDVRDAAVYALIGQVFAAGEAWLAHRRFGRDRLVDILVTLFVGGIAALAAQERASS